MKHSTKIFCIEIMLIIASLFLLLFSFHYYIYVGFLFLLSLLISFVLKVEKRNERFNSDIFLITLITILFYYAFTYFLGFFSGFYYSNYSRSFIGIISNIFFSFVMIYSIESIRYTLIKNNAYHKSIVWITPIICFLLELPTLVNFRVYSSRTDIFSAILTTLLPSFVQSFLITYITYKSNKKNSIMYRLLLIIPTYLLPVLPNLGEFFTIIVQLILPVIVLILIMNISTVKFIKIKNSRKLASNKILIRSLNACIILLLIIMVYLTSNMFRFTSLAIGSGSMTGTINKGDIVIIDKRDKNVKRGDIIAFKEQGKIIVHRLINIKSNHKIKFYQTKGDANKSKDNWLVSKENIVGKVKLRIRWIGWPTVALSELLQG